MKIHAKPFVGIVLGMLLLATPGQAGYSSAVPRWVTLNPTASARGSAGYIRMVVAPGGVDVTYNFCSTGATDGVNCDLNYLYSSDQLLALFQSLQRANAAGQKVAWAPMPSPRATVVWFGYP
jgi:hypothetical protein